MAIVLITCKGYEVIREISLADYNKLPALCAAEELARGDGYTVLASHNGRLVAEAGGWCREFMADQDYESKYAYACGYQD